MLGAQLDAILSDTQVQAVKIGMLGGAAQVRAVAAALRQYAPPNIVLDPVLASTGGVPLLDAEGREALLAELMPLCDLIAPNVPELGELTDMATQYGGERAEAVRRLQALGAKAVLVKGGHLPYHPVDRLFQPGPASTAFGGNARVETKHTHGTGCLLSSAIAARLAGGQELKDAISAAKELVWKSLHYPVVIGAGRGYPDVQKATPLEEATVFHSHARLLSALRGVYIVTDTTLWPGRTIADISYDSTDGGARTVQIRAKSEPTSS